MNDDARTSVVAALNLPRLERWLRRHEVRARTFWTRDSRGCPVVIYLKAVTGLEVYVTAELVTAVDECDEVLFTVRTPPDVGFFVRLLDGTYDRPRQVTAGIALNVLLAAKEE